MKIVTDGVLAGAYASAGARRKGVHNMMPNQKIVTHSYDDDDRSEGAKTLCGKLTLDKFAGAHSDEPPTCKLCLKRDPRFHTVPKPHVQLTLTDDEFTDVAEALDFYVEARGEFRDIDPEVQRGLERLQRKLAKARP